MIGGTVLFAVSCVERVGGFHLFPAGESCQFAVVAVGAVYMNVESERITVVEFFDFQRHIIVHMVGGKSYVECLHTVVLVYYCHVAHLCFLLDGHEQILTGR